MLVILSLAMFCISVVFVYCLEQLLFILRFIVQVLQEKSLYF